MIYYLYPNKYSLLLFIIAIPSFVSLTLIKLNIYKLELTYNKFLSKLIISIGSTSYGCYVFHLIIFYICFNTEIGLLGQLFLVYIFRRLEENQ